MGAGLLMFVSRVAKACRAAPVTCVPARRGLLALADVPDRERRDGFSQLVVRCKHSVIPMPVLPRRRDEIGEPVQELKRREFDNAVGPRPRGLAAAARPDPVGGFVSGQHVADFGYAAVCTADHGEPLCQPPTGLGGVVARTDGTGDSWIVSSIDAFSRK